MKSLPTEQRHAAPTTVPHTAPSPDALRAAEAKAAEYLAGWQRARADYENLHKRLHGELAGATDHGQDALLRELLPTLDAFEAAVAALPGEWHAHPWTEGFTRIHGALHTLLERLGVGTISETGGRFDPTRQEAVAEELSPLPTGTVTAVITRGYHRNGRVLRPARVNVSAGKGEEAGTKDHGVVRANPRPPQP